MAPRTKAEEGTYVHSPYETKVAQVLKDHKQHIKANTDAQAAADKLIAAQVDVIAALETRLAKVEALPILHSLPWKWTLSAWAILLGTVLVLGVLIAGLMTARSQVAELTRTVEDLKPVKMRQATEAEIEAMINARSTEVVAPVRSTKRRATAPAYNNDPLGIRTDAGAAPNTSSVPATVSNSTPVPGGSN